MTGQGQMWSGNPQDRVMERTRVLLERAVAGLTPEDVAARAAWCKEHNDSGVRMFTTERDDILEFRWGGRPLLMIRSEDLESDVPLVAEFVSEIPDTIPDF